MNRETIRCPKCGYEDRRLYEETVSDASPDGVTYYDFEECEKCKALMRVEVNVTATVDVIAASADDLQEWAAMFPYQEWARDA